MWNNKLIMGGCCNEPWCGERDDGWILRRAKSGCHRQLLYTWEMLLSSLCMVKWPDTVTHTLWFFFGCKTTREVWLENETIQYQSVEWIKLKVCKHLCTVVYFTALAHSKLTQVPEEDTLLVREIMFLLIHAKWQGNKSKNKEILLHEIYSHHLSIHSREH